MMTIWGETGVPESAAYPRPMLVRGDDTWRSLNGKWQIDTRPESLESPPFGVDLNETILVPYPIESTLSGVRRLTDQGYAWYRLSLSAAEFAPTPCAGRTLLHFEASDWNTTVFLNGQALGHHAGGYDPFLFDVTAVLAQSSDVELVVGTFDLTADSQATGKQRAGAFAKPGGIFYTSTSGIWGTVWTECVPSAYLSDVASTTDPVEGRVMVEVELASDGNIPVGLRVHVAVTPSPEDSTELVSASVSVSGRSAMLSIDLPKPVRLWNPASPELYGLSVKLMSGDEVFDITRSYFGVRALTLGKTADGRALPLLNGQPLFMMGTLDQGFWPDGIYTAPTDEALRSDLVAHKSMGFNMVRKHIKMEPRRWYWHCDTLGLLVWQDVPSKEGSDGLGSPVYDQWLLEMQRDVKARRSHPSIVLWVTYNEGWGQTTANDGTVENTIATLKEVDPSRLINDASGGRGIAFWVGGLHGDFTDVHHYSRPEFNGADKWNISSADPTKALVLGEYGGILFTPPGHEWAEGKCHGYPTAKMKSRDDVSSLYASYNKGLVDMVANWEVYPALAAAVYTEISDVETECNGLLTYDRLFKVDPEKIFKSNQELIANATAILAAHVAFNAVV